ncbi:MAG: hypothetical protein ABH835_00535 [Patescibacteria group bacterium]
MKKNPSLAGKKLELLTCYIHKKKLLDEVLERLIELDVGGVTVQDSTGIGRAQIHDIVLHSSFKNILNQGKKDHYTVQCIIPATEVNLISKELTKIYGNFKEQGIGFFFTSPVNKAWGINLPNNKK